MRDFFALAATEVRREPLDLARHFARANRAAAGLWQAPVSEDSGPAQRPAPSDDPDELERWCRFHEDVERLPVEEREVVGLLFYHGRQQAEVAELLGVTVRTVQRRWLDAKVKLHTLLSGE
jgi:RNA polymerase sigma factor (sigma-70 family)